MNSVSILGYRFLQCSKICLLQFLHEEAGVAAFPAATLTQ